MKPMWTILGAVAAATLIVLGGAVLIRKAALFNEELEMDDLSSEELREILEQLGEALGENDTDDDNIIVAIDDRDEAWWIDDKSGLMHAPVTEDGEVDFDAAERYNAFTAPRSELRRIMFILDKIKET
jgi:dipeptidase